MDCVESFKVRVGIPSGETEATARECFNLEPTTGIIEDSQTFAVTNDNLDSGIHEFVGGTLKGTTTTPGMYDMKVL